MPLHPTVIGGHHGNLHSPNTNVDRYRLCSEGKNVIVIDSGANSNLSNFEKGLGKAAIQPKQIKLIIITQGHWDLIDSAKAIKQLTAAKVLLHQNDVNLISATVPPPPPGLTAWGKIGNLLLRLYAPGEYDIPGKIIHTPGHTKGSISVLMDNGEALVGDLAMNMFPLSISPGFPIIGDDIEVVKNSWRKLLDMGVTTIYPEHGKPFPAEVIEKAIA